MRWIIITSIAIVMATVGCSKDKTVEIDFPELKKEIAGLWTEAGECPDCREVKITLDELTVELIGSDTRETMPYTFFTKDSIQVYRNIDGKMMHTRHKVISHVDGTLELQNFTRGIEQVVYSLPTDVKHFHPMVLERK